MEESYQLPVTANRALAAAPFFLLSLKLVQCPAYPTIRAVVCAIFARAYKHRSYAHLLSNTCSLLPNAPGSISIILSNSIRSITSLGCALAAIIRPARKEKREIHWLADFTPVIVMAIAMIGNFYGHVLNFFPFNQFNLFGAESIALWITGIDFILLSLKKEVDPVTDERSRKRRSMEQPAHQNLPPGPATA